VRRQSSVTFLLFTAGGTNILVDKTTDEGLVLTTHGGGTPTSTTANASNVVGAFHRAIVGDVHGSASGECVSVFVVETGTSAVNVFTGAVSTSWDDAGNWSKNQLPPPSDSVFIGSDKAAVVPGGSGTPFRTNTRSRSKTCGSKITAR